MGPGGGRVPRAGAGQGPGDEPGRRRPGPQGPGGAGPSGGGPPPRRVQGGGVPGGEVKERLIKPVLKA
ncbi:hypothetical protein KQ693_12775 (plasmid) [Thermus sp. PS18]|nr:hypothetical protein KQ693_12775 [Thermus sp. PS18]